METVFAIIALSSLIAFIVGMFSPKMVWCSSRSKVALIFLELFFIAAMIGSRSFSTEKDAMYCIAILVLLAFIIGLFNPNTVECTSRGMVALLYLGLFFLFAFLGNCAGIGEELSKLDKEWNTEIEELESEKEVPVLEIGSSFTKNDENGRIELTFTNIEVRRTSKALSLVFTLFIKNDTGKNFNSVESDWKMLDSKGTVLDEVDVEDPSNIFSMTSFISVDPYSEESNAKMGYNVKEGATYYLTILGKIIGKVPIDKYMK